MIYELLYKLYIFPFASGPSASEIECVWPFDAKGYSAQACLVSHKNGKQTESRWAVM
jgi:hypothetical protein